MLIVSLLLVGQALSADSAFRYQLIEFEMEAVLSKRGALYLFTESEGPFDDEKQEYHIDGEALCSE